MELKEALEQVPETAKTFKGGTQLTPENHSRIRQETEDYYAARQKARELGATEYQLHLAMTGTIFVY